MVHDKREVVVPILEAIEALRTAIDGAWEAGDDQITALLILALRDLAETVDLAEERLAANEADRSALPKPGDTVVHVDWAARDGRSMNQV